MRKRQSELELELGDAQDIFMDSNQMEMDEFSQNKRKSMSSTSGSFWGVTMSHLGGAGTKVQARHIVQRTLTLREGPWETNKTLMIHFSGGFFFLFFKSLFTHNCAGQK